MRNPGSEGGASGYPPFAGASDGRGGFPPQIRRAGFPLPIKTSKINQINLIDNHKVNNRIIAREVRVIADDGAQLGIMATAEALQLARSKDLDLVEVSANANPPVCRIMDFGKLLYQKEKEARKKKTKQTEMRMIKIGPHTAPHDLEVKAKKISEFLEDGDRVNAVIFLRGREKAFQEAARKKLTDFIKMMQPEPKMESELKKLPNGYSVVISKAQQ
jgi:translation initiation factor IF-3